MFGSRIVGVSLLAPCRMRFQRTVGGVRSVADIELAPRSAYLLSGKGALVLAALDTRHEGPALLRHLQDSPAREMSRGDQDELRSRSQPQDTSSPRTKSTRHRKVTADKWNQ